MCLGSENAGLLTGQFRDRLLKSIEYLKFKARNHNAVAAHDYVSSVISEQEKYSVYRDLFPQEWATSQASFYQKGYYIKYSERTNELFHLINNKCFPLLDYLADDRENEFENFYIPPLNVDLCCEDIYFENLNTSYAAGLIFYFPDDAWDYLNERLGLSKRRFPKINPDPHPGVWKEKGCIFGDLLRFIDHSTDNPWLDSIYCQMSDWYGFNLETIQELTSEYAAACKLLESLKPLDALIEAHPKKMLSALIDFWNNGNLPDETMLSPTRTGKVS